MGYSIAVKCQNKFALEKMYNFLSANYKPYSEAINSKFDKIYDGTCDIKTGDEFSYIKGMNHIGFNYSCAPVTMHYFMWAFLSFVALRVGFKKEFKKFPELKGEKYPYLNYDSQYDIPVLTNEQAEKLNLSKPTLHEVYIVDETGYKCTKYSKSYALKMIEVFDEFLYHSRRNIKNELKRLSKLWETAS